MSAGARTAAGAAPLDLLSFGEALIDFFPPRPGIALAECDVFHRHLGGAPCNVAVGAQRLGLRAGLMTLVGPDEFGEFVRARLVAEGVDVAGLGVHASAKTGVTFVSVDARGERRFLFFRHPSADQMVAPADVDPALVARARVVHLGSSTLTREPARAATFKLLEAARASGALLSVDPNWRAHLWDAPAEAPALVRPLLAQADVVKISDDELLPLVGVEGAEAGARAIRALGARLAIVTLGARGCWFDGPGGAGHVDGERVAVVDTTGAGDGFVAGLWAALLPALLPALRGARRVADLALDEIRAACAAANHAGARVVTRLGATAGLTPAPRMTREEG